MKLRFLRSASSDLFNCRAGDVIDGADLPEEMVERMRRRGLVAVMPDAPARPAWPLTMRPEVYLDRYPWGPHSELARSVVGDVDD